MLLCLKTGYIGIPYTPQMAVLVVKISENLALNSETIKFWGTGF